MRPDRKKEKIIFVVVLLLIGALIWSIGAYGDVALAWLNDNNIINLGGSAPAFVSGS